MPLDAPVTIATFPSSGLILSRNTLEARRMGDKRPLGSEPDRDRRFESIVPDVDLEPSVRATRLRADGSQPEFQLATRSS